MTDSPDLQKLVESSGGYDRITPEAWAQYDEAVARYHAAKIKKLRDEQSKNQLPRRGRP